MNKKLFNDKYIGYHTFGLLLDSIKSENPSKNKFEYVDLNLPSGTLWAKCNIGAESEADFGEYFLWGDTQGHKVKSLGTEGAYMYRITDDFNFSEESYKFYDTDGSGSFLKYDEGIDDKIIMDAEDDAAHVNIGVLWSIPSEAAVAELLDLTTLELSHKTDKYGNTIYGVTFLSKNGNSLFLPYSNLIPTANESSLPPNYHAQVEEPATDGYFWINTLNETYANGLCLYMQTVSNSLSLNSPTEEIPEISIQSSPRSTGIPIRPVILGNFNLAPPPPPGGEEERSSR